MELLDMHVNAGTSKDTSSNIGPIWTYWNCTNYNATKTTQYTHKLHGTITKYREPL